VIPLIEMDKFKPSIDMAQERAFIDGSRAEIRGCVETVYQQAEEILGKFKKYNFLLDGTVHKQLKGMFKDTNQLDTLNRE
jgi:hypothetical protein